jgi:vacuolar protein-sorting-associated protein 4
MSNFQTKGIELIQQALDEDNKKNYEEAARLYSQGADYLLFAIKHEKTPSVKEVLRTKVAEYISRAEVLKGIIKNNHSAVAVGADNNPKEKGGDGVGTPKTVGKLSDQEEQLRNALKTAIVKEKPNVKWSQIAGLEAAKESLREAVEDPIKMPHLFHNRLEPWNGILLYGPPGTGKTQLARAAATEVDTTFFSIKSSDLVSKWLGESEKLVKHLFALARENKPSIIFIDEIDALCSSRSGEGNDGNETTKRIKDEFLAQMDGVGSQMDGVLILGATNYPNLLDTAILRRFQKRVYVPLPDEGGRAHMFKILLEPVPHALTQQDFVKLGKETIGYSGSDIKTVVKQARYEANRVMKQATHFKKVQLEGQEWWTACSPGDPAGLEQTYKQLDQQKLLNRVWLPPVSVNDCIKAIHRCKTSVSSTDIKRCEDFTMAYGENGNTV